jgi:hypothetical protein
LYCCPIPREEKWLRGSEMKRKGGEMKRRDGEKEREGEVSF